MDASSRQRARYIGAVLGPDTRDLVARMRVSSHEHTNAEEGDGGRVAGEREEAEPACKHSGVGVRQGSFEKIICKGERFWMACTVQGAQHTLAGLIELLCVVCIALMDMGILRCRQGKEESGRGPWKADSFVTHGSRVLADD